MAENCDFLVDGYFPKQFLHYHRAGHIAMASLRTQRDSTVFVHMV